MNLNRSWFFSPVAPSLLLLFGLTFGFAIAHILGITWTSFSTRIYYFSLLMWAGVLLMSRRQVLRQLCELDYLMLVFIGLVFVSLAFQKNNAATSYYAKLLPFFVLLPYCLGRISEKSDLDAFLRLLPILGVLIFLLTLVDFHLRPTNQILHTRWIYFGVNHSPLLVANILSIAILALVYGLMKKIYLEISQNLIHQIFSWIVIGVMVAASVHIAARGALIACALVLIVMVIAIRASWIKKVSILIYFFSVALAAFYSLPPSQSEFYANLRNNSEDFSFSKMENSTEYADIQEKIKNDPRCKPLLEALNSVSIRRVLYYESIELAMKHPLIGVGASNFGLYSCSGLGAYPHSSLLQAFAELGFLGGMTLLALYLISFINILRNYILVKFYYNINDHIFWLALIAYFGLTDQIYGNYFMTAGSFFMFAVAARLRINSNVNTVRS